MAKKSKKPKVNAAGKMVIHTSEIQTRRSWGSVRPFTRDHGDKKKEQAKKVCRRPVNRGDFSFVS